MTEYHSSIRVPLYLQDIVSSCPGIVACCHDHQLRQDSLMYAADVLQHTLGRKIALG